ncbi:hypothetical protein N7486_005005 [Penicillium sp. IBT 16267x]|nr:hypothetical protein N7486_005005 [Penicillium sp. IBT 16267x]
MYINIYLSDMEHHLNDKHFIRGLEQKIKNNQCGFDLWPAMQHQKLVVSFGVGGNDPTSMKRSALEIVGQMIRDVDSGYPMPFSRATLF